MHVTSTNAFQRRLYFYFGTILHTEQSWHACPTSSLYLIVECLEKQGSDRELEVLKDANLKTDSASNPQNQGPWYGRARKTGHEMGRCKKRVIGQIKNPPRA